MLSKYCDQADISKCKNKIESEDGEKFTLDSLKDASKMVQLVTNLKSSLLVEIQLIQYETHNDSM